MTVTHATATAPTRMEGYLSRHANQPVLGVRRPLWRMDDEHAHVSSEAFAATRAQIFKRDNDSCRFCDFKAARFQEIHHLDGDHQNNDPANLLTACTLCHQVHHLGMCAMRQGGYLAAIPELTQTEINNLMRAIYVSELLGDQATCDRLTGLVASFQYRGSDTLKQLFGADVVTPHQLAMLLADPKVVSDQAYSERAERLAPLRLVPTRHAFQNGQLAWYASQLPEPFSARQWTRFADVLSNPR